MSPRRGPSAVVVAGALSALALSGMLGSSTGTTYAAYSDTALIAANVAGAGIWAPDPPAACGDPADYSGVVYGSPGDDVLIGGNQRQVLMGLGGDDVIRGGNSGDCLVGGLGNDRIYGGNAKDVLIGGDNDDLLEGNNGKDLLDGGPGLDTCVGGNGVDVLQECESGDADPTAPLRLTSQVDTPLLESPQLVAASPSAVGTTLTEPSPSPEPALAPQPGSGASVEDPPEAPLAETLEPELVQPSEEAVVPTDAPVDEVQP